MRLLVACILIAITASGVASAAETKGAGSTFVDPVLAKWAEAYRSKTGSIIAYQAIGSSLGISKIKAATVDFGATDRPLSPEELASSGLGQFPIVIGGIVPVVNLDGIKSGRHAFYWDATSGYLLDKNPTLGPSVDQGIEPRTFQLPSFTAWMGLAQRSIGSTTCQRLAQSWSAPLMVDSFRRRF